MTTLMNDLRYTLRGLARNPGFAVVAVLTLGLGIGANSAIFSVVNAVLLRPPPQVREPERLVQLYTSDYSGPLYGASSYPDYEAFRDGADAFSGLAAYGFRPVQLAIGDRAELTAGELVSGNYFSVLGVTPAVGRLILPSDDDVPGRAPVAVISYTVWQRSFGLNPDVVGRTVRLNGQPYTIIGVAPPGFAGSTRPLAAGVWVPMAMADRLTGQSGDDSLLEERGSRWLGVIGRLADGATLERAQAQVTTLAAGLHARYPGAWTDVREATRRVTLLPEPETRVPPAARGAVLGFVGMLMGVVGLVLLIACANVANLLLARATQRRREIAIRLAVGAGRGRLVRQLLTESLVLALLGGGAGLLIALWLTDLLTGFQPPLPLPIALDVGLDGRVVSFALAVSVLTGIIFGLVPALEASRPELVPALKDESGAARVGGRRPWLRSALVVGQVAVSLVLLIGAGLFVRSLRNAAAVDLGFDPEGVLLATLMLDLEGYTPAEGRVFYTRLLERVEALPGVESAAVAEVVPLMIGNQQRRSVSIEGYEPAPGEDMEFDFNGVSAGYFELMRMPLARGRGFTAEDREGAPLVVVVNETFARRFWPGEDPIGKRLSYRRDAFAEVVGVVRDAPVRSRAEPQRAQFFIPHAQDYRGNMMLHVRTAGDPAALAPAVRGAVRELDADLALLNVTTLEQAVGGSLLPQRAAAALLGGFGSLAVLLAMIGLYGVMAYAVASRTREVGIRMALGARGPDVVRMIVGRGMGLVALGLGLGLLAAVAVTRLASQFLFDVSATDPASFTAAAVALAAVALVAAYLPARRAARVDPIVALRNE
ncbi:MAG TPA: ABC transporter permease [Longimicrobiales bacterium]